VQHIFCKFFEFSRHLRVAGYSFHCTCIFCVYGIGQYWPTPPFYVCTYVSFVYRHVAPPGECYYNTLLDCEEYFLSSSVVSSAFSALCVYTKFGHHLHPLGYLCTKFRFFRDLHSPLLSYQLPRTQSLTHSA